MSTPNPLLSICIPTYNRIEFLTRALSSILIQMDGLENVIEIIISDNASTDETENYCKEIVSQSSNVYYSKHEVNKGPDYNIAHLYSKAKGHFVWVLGDDDYLSDGSLSNICSLLKNNLSTNIIYVNSKPHTENIDKTVSVINYTTIDNNEVFAKRIGVYFTFISGVIVNKAINKVSKEFVDKYQQTSLIQLSWVYTALKNGTRFIIINNHYVIVQVDNTGGYKLFTVFAKNLASITNDFFSGNVNRYIRNSAMFLLSHYVLSNKKGQGFEKEDYIEVCNQAFSDLAQYKLFYRYIFSNSFLALLFNSTLRMLRRLKSFLRGAIRIVRVYRS